MFYTDALKAHDIIKEIELNNKDIDRIRKAIVNGIVGVELTIKCIGGTFKSTIYENDRIDLLLKVLCERNDELMEKLEKL